MADTGDRVQRKYQNFRGVDFRGEECSPNRSPDSMNVWRNYKKLSCIETRPALQEVCNFPGEPIRAMRWHGKKLFFIADDGFVYATNDDGSRQYEKIVNVGSEGILFSFEGKMYALGNYDYCSIEEKEDGTLDAKSVEPYIPYTSIGRAPSGGGKIKEDVNLLTGWRYNTFVADGTSLKYYLDAHPDNKAGFPRVFVNKVELNYSTEFVSTLDEYGSCIRFSEAPEAPLSDGQANIEVLFHKEVEGYKEKVLNCTLFQEFDNRIFLSGNPDEPSTLRYSALHDVSYFSDTDYYVDGADQEPIRSMVAGNNGLWVFRNVTNANSGVFYHTPAIDEDFGKVYPYSHSSISIGCKGRAINFNDDIVFFSGRGMESASTDITTEQFATHRSSLVDRRMLDNDDKYKRMNLVEWNGYLLVCIDSNIYLADSRAVTQIENHVEYEWYYWDFGGHEITSATVHNDILYLGMKGNHGDGYIMKLTGIPEEGDMWYGSPVPIKSYWTTPKDTFNAPNKQKTTNKKGCIVEATGDISVLVKTDDSSIFNMIGTAEGVEDFFVTKIKRKKFKDLQLRFYSETGFSLESVTMECFIGGYVKHSGNVVYADGGDAGSGGGGVTNGKQGIKLKDTVTNQTYTITVEDGKLTMEKKE